MVCNYCLILFVLKYICLYIGQEEDPVINQSCNGMIYIYLYVMSYVNNIIFLLLINCYIVAPHPVDMNQQDNKQNDNTTGIYIYIYRKSNY